MTTDTDTSTPATAFTVLQALTPGLRVRVTWPNGFQRTGVIGRTRFRSGESWATLDGDLIGGEFDNASSVEVMGTNDRYAEHWSTPATT